MTEDGDGHLRVIQFPQRGRGKKDRELALALGEIGVGVERGAFRSVLVLTEDHDGHWISSWMSPARFTLVGALAAAQRELLDMPE